MAQKPNWPVFIKVVRARTHGKRSAPTSWAAKLTAAEHMPANLQTLELYPAQQVVLAAAQLRAVFTVRGCEGSFVGSRAYHPAEAYKCWLRLNCGTESKCQQVRSMASKARITAAARLRAVCLKNMVCAGKRKQRKPLSSIT